MIKRIILIVIFLAIAILIFAYTQFTAKVNSEVGQLFSKNNYNVGVITEDMLKDLPSPVQKYLRYSGVIGKPWINTVILEQTGQLRTSHQGKWMPFAAEEYYSVNPPGFVWRVRGPQKWLPIIQGRDGYIDGKGELLIKLISLFPVANAKGNELDQGAMMRYLNEMMWFPTAFLGENISWREINDTSAEVTLHDKDKTTTAILHFDEEGKLINFVAKRYMSSGNEFKFETWETPISDYREFEGFRLPSKGKAVWKLKDGDFEYIQLEIKNIKYK